MHEALGRLLFRCGQAAAAMEDGRDGDYLIAVAKTLEASAEVVSKHLGRLADAERAAAELSAAGCELRGFLCGLEVPASSDVEEFRAALDRYDAAAERAARLAGWVPLTPAK